MSSPTKTIRRAPSLRTAIVWICVGLTYVVALSFYKSSLMQNLARGATQTLKDHTQARAANLFQASYYFFFDDQFVPGIRAILGDTSAHLERLRFISNTGGGVLFDSQSSAMPPAGTQLKESFVLGRLSGREPAVFFDGFKIQILMPGSQYGILYTFDASAARWRVLLALFLGLALGFALHWTLHQPTTSGFRTRLVRAWPLFWRLRIKFLAAIVLVNLITAAIVFVTLTQLQTRSQTRLIERESVLFSQFSTTQIVSCFNRFFYFNYPDRFIPEIKKIIASNENLVSIRIISKRTGGVLYDSEQSEAAPLSGLETAKSDFSSELEAQLKTRDLATQMIERAGQPLLAVVNTYHGENQDSVFWVETLFSFQTLAMSIQEIKRQILLDLVPALGLGLLIAILFAQLLISPIRKLVSALGRVTEGDYDAHVDFERRDEIGDLATAFNSMTEELRKKKELRKYLSDSTYRMVMKTPDRADGAQIGGARVSASVLFTDIRDFVGHCENLEAEEVTKMLNEYFSEMVEVVHKHGGEVDKFIGDAMLAVFYDGEEAKVSTPLQALYCALEMRERLRELNGRRKLTGRAQIETGVGITHGELISGPIGSKDRMDFTVIGDVVNLASRIEKQSKVGKYTKIVFSQPIEEKIRGLLDYEEMPGEKVRGKEEFVRTFELIGVRDIRHLVNNLRLDDLALRRRSVELLGHSRNEEALGWVIGILSDSDESTRLQAVLSVAKLGQGPGEPGETAFSALLARLGKEASDKVLSALISAVGKLATEPRADRVIEALRPFLDSPNERIMANAVEALGQSRHPRCADLILPKLMSRNNRVKANAAMAMFVAGHIEVIDSLKPMLMHSDPLMRSSAAFAIGELTVIAEQDHLLAHWQARAQTLKLFLAELQECVPMLVACLRDVEPMVRRQAVIALGKIKDKSAVLPIIDLLDPKQGSRELIQDISEALRSIGSHKLVREVIAKLSSS